MKAIPYVLVVCLLFALASTSWASVGVAIMDSEGNIVDAITNFKTPPLRTSETFRVVVDKHIEEDITNFAGFRLKFHILDGKEISLATTSSLYGFVPTMTPAGGTKTVTVPTGPLVPPTFPQSTQAATVSHFRTVWHPKAQQSGVSKKATDWVGMARLDLHAKSTDMGQNSDVDMTVMAWCIRHLRPGQGSTQFERSVLVWAPSHFTPQPGNPLPTDPIRFDDPNGQWKHINFPWHVPTNFFGSQFIATFAGTALIGLEHVPEPMTAALVGSGALLLVCSLGLRWRRLAR